jgi:hypothetical protein
MAHVILTYQTTLATPEGRTYRPRACGRPRDDGTWEGWLEFLPNDASEVVRSARETTQPNLADLEYWATGLTPIYLEGALARALASPLQAAPAPVLETPVYDGPAPMMAAAAESPVVAPVLDPFSVYAKGESLLLQQLQALSPRHLRQIVRGYQLATDDVDLEVLGERELIALIMAGVRTRLAA